MKRFNFPIDYKPKVSLHDTLIYSSSLKNAIFGFLYEQYKTIYIDPCLFVSNLQSCLCYTWQDRYVSFDNKINDLIACFNSTQHNFLMLASKLFHNENYATFAPAFNRDAKLTNLSSMLSWMIHVELAMPEENMNDNYFVKFCQILFDRIAKIVKTNELAKLYEVDEAKFKPVDGFNVAEANKIERNYPTLSLADGFNLYCAKNKFVIVKGVFKPLKTNQSIQPTIPTSYDQDCCCGLYVYDYVNDEPINLINIFKRPDGEKAFTQLNKSNPIELENHVYNDELFDKNRKVNLGITINFSNLLFYLLDKVHLAEVVSSVWSDEFIKFIKEEKIEIL